MYGYAKAVLFLSFMCLLCSWSLGAQTSPLSDGIIGDDEYEHSESFDNGNYQLIWTVADDLISMGIIGKTTGWVGIGFAPTVMMKDADIILAGMKDDEMYWTDSFSTGNFGPHPPDTELGGTDDISNLTVNEQDGITTAEFVRKLDTGDEYDAVLTIGDEVSFLWAMSTEDDPQVKHNTPKGKGVITL